MYEKTIQELVNIAHESFQLNSDRVARLGQRITDVIEQAIKNRSSIDEIEKTLGERKQYDFYVSRAGSIKSFTEVQEHIYSQRQLGKLKRVVRVFVSDLEITSQSELKQSDVSYVISDATKIKLDDSKLHAFVVTGDRVKIDGGNVEYKQNDKDLARNIAVYAEGKNCVVKNMRVKNVRYPRPFAWVTLEENIESYD